MWIKPQNLVILFWSLKFFSRHIYCQFDCRVKENVWPGRWRIFGLYWALILACSHFLMATFLCHHILRLRASRLLLKRPPFSCISQGKSMGKWFISVKLSGRCHTDQPPKISLEEGSSEDEEGGGAGSLRHVSSVASTPSPKATESAVCSTTYIVIDNLLQRLVTASQL